MSDDELADLLASEIEPHPIWRAATAEFKLREHRALLAQKEAAERQAEAAQRTAAATVRYTWYTFGVLVAAVVTAIATWFVVLK